MHIHSAPRAPYYRSQRSHNILLTAAMVLELLDEDGDEYIYLCGRMLDTKTITQTRMTMEETQGNISCPAGKNKFGRFDEFSARAKPKPSLFAARTPRKALLLDHFISSTIYGSNE